jgi:hypothetical protein
MRSDQQSLRPVLPSSEPIEEIVTLVVDNDEGREILNRDHENGLHAELVRRFQDPGLELQVTEGVSRRASFRRQVVERAGRGELDGLERELRGGPATTIAR